MSSATAGASADVAHASRRAIVAACVGNAAEWYDFAIYGSLATVIGLVFFPTQDLAIALSAAFATYGTAFLVRPLRTGVRSVGRRAGPADSTGSCGLPHGWRDDMCRAVARIRHDRSARAGCPGVVTCRSRARSRRRTRHRRRIHPGERAPRTERPDCSLAHSDDGDWNRDRHGRGRRALLPFQRDRP